MVDSAVIEEVVKKMDWIKSSKDGCGKVFIKIVKGKVTHIGMEEIEAVKE